MDNQAKNNTENKSNELKRIGFKKLIGLASTELALLPYDQVDAGINKILKEICLELKTVRGSVFTYNPHQKTVSNTHEWCKDPLDSQILQLQNVPLTFLEYYSSLLLQQKCVIIGQFDDLPKDKAKKEIKRIQEMGFRPLLFFPMHTDKGFQGALGIYGVIGEERIWPDYAITLLQYFANIIMQILLRKESEDFLKKSEVKFRTLVETSSDWIWEINSMGKYTYSSPQVEAILGYTPQEIIGKSPLNLLISREKSRISAIFTKLLKEIEPIVSLKNTCRHKDGRSIVLETSGRPFFDSKGIMLGYRGVDRDITERTQSEENLSLMAEIVNSAPSSFMVLDFKGHLLYANQQTFLMHGYTEEEFMKLDLRKINDPKSQKRIAPLMEKIIRTGEARFEVSHCRKDGSTFPVLVLSRKIMWGRKEAVLSIGTDLSERKKAEREQLKVKKLESVGILAGGIAHDFNNLLTGIFGNIELAKMSISPTHEAQNYLTKANHSMERATNLTKQLLTFAKGGDPIKKSIPIGDVIIETAQFSLHGMNCILKFDISPNLFTINADKGQISQVISNLVINAQQAMKTGGIITINANNIEVLKEKFVEIKIMDEGSGIEPENLERIFDPYYSTKETGSGLGLAITHSIILKHKGKITVISKVNKGTTFTILLPVSKQSSTIEKTVKEGKSQTSCLDGAKILFLDDEEMIRNIASMMIDKMGCQLDLVQNSKEAIIKYKEEFLYNNGYDLVITDYTIRGGLNGKETAEQILKINPQAKIIISSGYATNPVMANYASHGFKGVIIKPYTYQSLKSEIERVLKD